MDRALHNIHFRPIEPADRTRLQRFHRRLSVPTVTQRFHGAKLELTEPLARRFTELDGHEAAAIVATTGTRGRIVGVARYARLDPRRAEVAFVVEDAYQGRGIGRKLLERLIALARAEGIEELVAYVLPGNERMLRLLRGAGPTSVRYEGSAYLVTLGLQPEASDGPSPTIGGASPTASP
jgi:RimJ/RimL family protein N-acetyltransferase